MNAGSSAATDFLDITSELCPMTFVKVKLRLEGLPDGAVLDIRLAGEEPRVNLPLALDDMGCRVLSLDPEETPPPGGAATGPGRGRVYRLLVQKPGSSPP